MLPPFARFDSALISSLATSSIVLPCVVSFLKNATWQRPKQDGLYIALTKSPPNPLKFKAQLLSRGSNGAWTYLQIPFSVPEVFGRKGQIPVRATINGFTFRNSLMPRASVHILGAGKDILAGAGANPGDTVEVELAFDDTPRTVQVPTDLEAALANVPALAKAFAALSYSHKKEYADWIESAKKPETRLKRIEKAIEMLSARKTPKG